jgi:hypothetical protein
MDPEIFQSTHHFQRILVTEENAEILAQYNFDYGSYMGLPGIMYVVVDITTGMSVGTVDVDAFPSLYEPVS